MDAREAWNQYVELHGGPVGVSEKLGVPYSTVAGICNGSRGIGRILAKRMSTQDAALDENVLIWVTANAKRPAQTKAA